MLVRLCLWCDSPQNTPDPFTPSLPLSPATHTHTHPHTHTHTHTHIHTYTHTHTHTHTTDPTRLGVKTVSGREGESRNRSDEAAAIA